MVPLNQLDQVREMQTQGWKVVPHKRGDPTNGGPVLMVKHYEYPAENKWLLVYASSTLVEPTAEEVAGW